MITLRLQGIYITWLQDAYHLIDLAATSLSASWWSISVWRVEVYPTCDSFHDLRHFFVTRYLTATRNQLWSTHTRGLNTLVCEKSSVWFPLNHSFLSVSYSFLRTVCSSGHLRTLLIWVSWLRCPVLFTVYVLKKEGLLCLLVFSFSSRCWAWGLTIPCK